MPWIEASGFAVKARDDNFFTFDRVKSNASVPCGSISSSRGKFYYARERQSNRNVPRHTIANGAISVSAKIDYLRGLDRKARAEGLDASFVSRTIITGLCVVGRPAGREMS